jgi:hypothetical protein
MTPTLSLLEQRNLTFESGTCMAILFRLSSSLLPTIHHPVHVDSLAMPHRSIVFHSLPQLLAPRMLMHLPPLLPRSSSSHALPTRLSGSGLSKHGLVWSFTKGTKVRSGMCAGDHSVITLPPAAGIRLSEFGVKITYPTFG